MFIILTYLTIDIIMSRTFSQPLNRGIVAMHLLGPESVLPLRQASKRLSNLKQRGFM
jgi:hypothetical protein